MLNLMLKFLPHELKFAIWWNKTNASFTFKFAQFDTLKQSQSELHYMRQLLTSSFRATKKHLMIASGKFLKRASFLHA